MNPRKNLNTFLVLCLFGALPYSLHATDIRATRLSYSHDYTRAGVENRSIETKKEVHLKSKNGIFAGGQVGLILPVWAFGVLGGYQQYFGPDAVHGAKATIHVKSSFGPFLPIYFGVDAQYLWDFLRSTREERHVLGFNAGIGFGITNFGGVIPIIIAGLHYRYQKHHQVEFLTGYQEVWAVNYSYKF